MDGILSLALSLGQKGDEDVRLDAGLELVKDRPALSG